MNENKTNNENPIALHGTRPGHSSQLTRSYYDSLLIRMSYLDSGVASTNTTLFGCEFNSPICVSSLSHLDHFGYAKNGMEELGKASTLCNTVHFCGSGSLDELKRIIDTGAKTIKIIKPFKNTDLILEKMRFAEENGAFAVGMDIDHSFDFSGNIGSNDGEQLTCMDTETLKSIIQKSKLPFIVKGVLSVEDAQKCMDAGADGIFVSHHHGLFDFMTPPPMMLPEIAKIVNGRVPIIIDGNIESGYDVFKALALGADFTAIGRPLIPLISKGNAEDVAAWMRKQNDLLKGIMSRSCCRKISDIDNTHIIKK